MAQNKNNGERVLFSLHTHHLLSPLFLTTDFLTGVKGYLTVILIGITLLISDTEHLFIYPLAMWVDDGTSVDSVMGSFTSDAQIIIRLFFLI